MTTAANVKSTQSGHWYYPDGKTCYEIPRADGKGMRPPTLRDARKLNLLPGVTTILRVMHKEGLVQWLCEQTALAVLTTPRLENESLDAFVERVLKTERVQDEESQKAKDRGTDMHNGLESLFTDKPVDPVLEPWIRPAYNAVMQFGKPLHTEYTVVGEDYAGRVDLVQAAGDDIIIWDFKTAKKLPDPEKGGWEDHRLQLSAYANGYRRVQSPEIKLPGNIKTANCYLSTITPGQFVICHYEDWSESFHYGFAPLVQVWKYMNKYNPSCR